MHPSGIQCGCGGPIHPIRINRCGRRTVTAKARSSRGKLLLKDLWASRSFASPSFCLVQRGHRPKYRLGQPDPPFSLCPSENPSSHVCVTHSKKCTSSPRSLLFPFTFTFYFFIAWLQFFILLWCGWLVRSHWKLRHHCEEPIQIVFLLSINSIFFDIINASTWPWGIQDTPQPDSCFLQHGALFFFFHVYFIIPWFIFFLNSCRKEMKKQWEKPWGVNLTQVYLFI